MSTIYVLGVPSDDFTKKEIKDIFNGIYDTEHLSIEFHSVVERIGYVVFDILKSYDFEGFSLTELIELKNESIKCSEQKEQAIKDFFNKVNKPHLINEIDCFLYETHESLNDEFYRKMM